MVCVCLTANSASIRVRCANDADGGEKNCPTREVLVVVVDIDGRLFFVCLCKTVSCARLVLQWSGNIDV